MKKLAGILLFSAVMLLCGCSGNDDCDGMSRKEQFFISEYWPNSEMASYTTTATGGVAQIYHGPTLYFNTDDEWVSVDGNGVTLPRMFLFDQLPQPLYEHLEATENTASVYAVTRKASIYTVRLETRTLTYDSATESLTGN